MPAALGGGGCTTLQQVLVPGQAGRVTNALGWVPATPPSGCPSVATPDQLERYVRPAIRGEREECYAITEEGAGSDVDADRGDRPRTATSYLLTGVKWHVTSYNERRLRLLPGATHRRAARRRARDVPRGPAEPRASAWSARRPTRHTIGHHHPIVAFEGVRVPAAQPRRRRRRRHDVRVRVVPLRAADGRRPLPGRGPRLIEETTAFARNGRAAGGRSATSGLVQAMLADSLTELFAARR